MVISGFIKQARDIKSSMISSLISKERYLSNLGLIKTSVSSFADSFETIRNPSFLPYLKLSEQQNPVE